MAKVIDQEFGMMNKKYAYLASGMAYNANSNIYRHFAVLILARSPEEGEGIALKTFRTDSPLVAGWTNHCVTVRDISDEILNKWHPLLTEEGI